MDKIININTNTITCKNTTKFLAQILIKKKIYYVFSSYCINVYFTRIKKNVYIYYVSVYICILVSILYRAVTTDPVNKKVGSEEKSLTMECCKEFRCSAFRKI